MNRLSCFQFTLSLSKCFLFSLSLLLSGITAFGQGEDQTNQGQGANIQVPTFGIGLNAGVPTMLGVKFNAQLSNRFSLDLSLGFGYAAGLRYSITNPIKHRFTVYTGLYYTSKVIEESLDSMGEKVYGQGINGQGLYMPIGISYLGKRNFQYTLEFGGLYSAGLFSPTAGISAAYRFNARPLDKVANPLTQKRNIFSFSLFGMTPIMGVVYERLLNPYFGIEAGIGLPSIGAGLKIYPKGIREDKWTAHLGASHHFFVFPWAGGWKTYFPLGLSKLKSSGLRIGFDVGPQLNWYDGDSDLFFNGNFRIGKAF